MTSFLIDLFAITAPIAAPMTLVQMSVIEGSRV